MSVYIPFHGVISHMQQQKHIRSLPAAMHKTISTIAPCEIYQLQQRFMTSEIKPSQWKWTTTPQFPHIVILVTSNWWRRYWNRAIKLTIFQPCNLKAFIHCPPTRILRSLVFKTKKDTPHLCITSKSVIPATPVQLTWNISTKKKVDPKGSHPQKNIKKWMHFSKKLHWFWKFGRPRILRQTQNMVGLWSNVLRGV